MPDSITPGLRAFPAIILYAVAVFLLGALFAPWLFWTIQWVAPHLPIGGERLAGQPFRRIFSRALLIVGIIGLWPLFRASGIRSWSEIGWVRRRDWWRQFLVGWLVGLGSFGLAAVGAGLLGRGGPAGDRSTDAIGSALLRYLLTGLVVAVIEETFFRGGLQRAMQQMLRLPLAIAVASAIYSALHFLKPSGLKIAADAVTWTSGFDCLGRVATRSYASPDMAVAFVSLFLVGFILGWAFARTGTLYLSVGLHAGWVLANEFARWWGAGKLTENVVTWPVLGLTFVLVAWWCRSYHPPR